MKRTEASEQSAVIAWANVKAGKYPALRWLHHIPNGGSRNRIEAARLKAQGVRSGVADLFLPAARGGRHGLYVEMKWGKNRLTQNQRDFLNDMEREGYATAVCYSADEAIRTIERYLRDEA